MNLNYFSKVKILDGGMGQQILAKGLKPKGSLWSGTALIDKNYHQMVIDSHLDFIKSGADVIVTNNFAGRRVRMAHPKMANLRFGAFLRPDSVSGDSKNMTSPILR